MALWYLFNFIIKKVSNINITSNYLSLGVIDKRFDKKKLYLIVLIDFRSKILIIYHTLYEVYSKTQ